MSDESLFSKHMRLIEKDELNWTEEEKQQFASLELPPLVLPPAKRGLWASVVAWWNLSENRLFARPAMAALSFGGIATLVFVSVFLSRQTTDVNDRLAPKGALQVAVFWERDGKVSPLTSESSLRDGDKVGASVLSSEESVAYWAITDRDYKILSEASDVEFSRISLQAGVRKSFESSFQLVAPNQGENLIVVVCPKEDRQDSKSDTAPLFDQPFVSKLTSESRIRSSQCVFVGSRLRRSP